MNIAHLIIPSWVIDLYIFIIGMCLGSFLMVVGCRLPRQETLLGRSHCESCQRQLTARMLFPVISYVFLKGKCRYCQAKIGVSMPLFELLAGGLFVLNVWLNRFTGEALIGCSLIILLLIISVTDQLYCLIPNKVLLPFLILGVIERTVLPQNNYWWYSLAGFFFILVFMLLLSEFSKQGLGGGDIKLLAVVGVYIGPIQVFVALFLAALTALVFYLCLGVISGVKRKYIPFGPFLAVGTLLTYFGGQFLTGGYY